MIGYKIASTEDGKRALVTLKIGSDSNTNLYRNDIVDKMYAKYRCDKATVVSIVICDTDEPVTWAYTSFYTDKRIKYIVGEDVVEPSYNKDIDVVCGEGIHFFLSKEVAMLYGLDKVENGEYKMWYNNGQLHIQTTYLEGKRHGEYKMWYRGADERSENGQLEIQTTYAEGEVHGEYKMWYENGQLEIQTTYAEGEVHGEYKEWWSNGQLRAQTTYVEDKLHGEYKEWWSKGQLRVQTTYVENIMESVNRGGVMEN